MRGLRITATEQTRREIPSASEKAIRTHTRVTERLEVLHQIREPSFFTPRFVDGHEISPASL